MLPQKRPESDEGNGGRAGLEVRVIGGERQAPVSGAAGRLEIGLRIGSGPADATAGVEEDEGPVHRLEGAEPLRARPMSEVGPAGPLPPSRRRARRGLAQWTAWMAAGTCTLAVAAVAGMMSSRKSAPSGGLADFTMEAEEPLDAENVYFLSHTGELTVEAERLLERYAAATSADETLGLLRDAERVKSLMPGNWTPWGSTPAFAPSVPLETSVIEEEGRSALAVEGRKGDFSKFQMAFVREGGTLKIDWEASFGIGDVQVGELRSGTVVKDRMIRAVIRPGKFHTPEFPEAEFGSYQLLDAAGEQFVWAFARKDSPVSALLEAELNQDSILLEKTAEFRAALRVSGPLREGVNLFVITEMLHKGWVTP